MHDPCINPDFEVSPSGSRRLPGGTRRSSSERDRSSCTSFLKATRSTHQNLIASCHQNSSR